MAPTGLFIQTLNEMIDNQEKRVMAYNNRVPDIVLIGLYSIAFVAMAFAGFGAKLDSRRSRLPVYLTGLIVCAVMLLIQDLDRPDAELIRTSQKPMIDTAASLAAFPDSGPARGRATNAEADRSSDRGETSAGFLDAAPCAGVPANSWDSAGGRSSGAAAPLETRGSYSQRNALVSQPTEFIHFFHAAQHEIFLTPSIPKFIHDSSELSQDDCSCEVQRPAIG